MSPVPAAALLASLAALALAAERTWVVAAIAVGLLVACLQAPRARRFVYLAGTLVSALSVFVLSPFVSSEGSHVIWEGPLVPVLGVLDVTSEELATAGTQALRLATAVGMEFRHRLLDARAAGLVYTRLLALVPFLAVMFSVLKGFGVHHLIEPFLAQTLEPLGPNRTRLIQEERFTGVLVGLFASSLDQHTLAGFHAMNAALKARGETSPLGSAEQEVVDAAVQH